MIPPFLLPKPLLLSGAEHKASPTSPPSPPPPPSPQGVMEASVLLQRKTPGDSACNLLSATGFTHSLKPTMILLLHTILLHTILLHKILLRNKQNLNFESRQLAGSLGVFIAPTFLLQEERPSTLITQIGTDPLLTD